ncbi:MAG: serine/threonine-protein kinase [Planctomycetota bacterium]
MNADARDNPPTAAPAKRSTVGPYELVGLIGEGGFGEVWRATATHTGPVAVKLFKPIASPDDVVARFRREAEAIAACKHPSIVRILDAQLTKVGQPYVVLELVRGLPITDHCDAERMPIPERLRVFADVCRAVDHAHRSGIIHGDLKPSNVLVSSTQPGHVPKIIDFGVATATGADPDAPPPGWLAGTPEYMSPEQAAASGAEADPQWDVYSLGCLLYELVTGKRPYHNDGLDMLSVWSLTRYLRELDPADPSAWYHPGEPDSECRAALRGLDARHLAAVLETKIGKLVARSIAKDPHQRFRTAADLADAATRTARKIERGGWSIDSLLQLV